MCVTYNATMEPLVEKGDATTAERRAFAIQVRAKEVEAFVARPAVLTIKFFERSRVIRTGKLSSPVIALIWFSFR